MLRELLCVLVFAGIVVFGLWAQQQDEAAGTRTRDDKDWPW